MDNIVPLLIIAGFGLSLILLILEMIRTYKTERFMFYIRRIFAILSIIIMLSIYLI